ncbi:hypothetical protein, partial [Shimia thalassica]|uniref:hypothetical protein n=1 Tax=Shimia thalassica TaxID=1715693 RepID=UPI0026E14342
MRQLTLRLGSGNDWVAGGIGDDYLHGGDGNDTLEGGEGSDTLIGGEGEDQFYLELAEQDIVEGGSGDDWLTVRFVDPQISGINPYILEYYSFYDANGNVLLRLGNKDSGAFDHELTGSSTDSVLQALNLLPAVQSTGQIGIGTSYTYPSAHTPDVLFSGIEHVNIDESGTLPSGYTSLSLYLYMGGDLYVSAANGHFAADWSDQTIAIRWNNETQNVQTLQNGVTVGNMRQLTLRLGSGNDWVAGGIGDDYLHGGDGNDTLDGGEGYDTLIGGEGEDFLNGGVDEDLLVGGVDDDVLGGGNGHDTYQIALGDGVDTILDPDGGEIRFDSDVFDILSLARDGSVLEMSYGEGADQIRILNFFSQTHVWDFYFDGTLQTVDTSAFYDEWDQFGRIVTRTGTDDVQNWRLFDVGEFVYLKGGNDVVFAGVGSDLIDGGAGTDIVSYQDSTEGVTISLNGDAGTGGWAEGDRLRGVEVLQGSVHIDTLSGTDLAEGFAGEEGADVLNGRGGNDTLNGGEGSDVLHGGEGVDTAIFHWAFDEIASISGDRNFLYLEFATETDQIAHDVEFFQFSDITRTFAELYASVPHAPTGEVLITGLAEQGQTLTADASTLADGNGLGTFGYQWLRDGQDVGGATGESYTLGQADVGAEVAVRVSYVDGSGVEESVTSAASAAVENVNDAVQGEVLLVGAALEGEVISIETSGLSDPDGLDVFTYQWLRDSYAIAGEIDATYLLVQADAGASVSVRVSYVDGEGTTETLESVPISDIQPLVVDIVGTDENDRLSGTTGNDTLNGGDGNDTLIGREGDDTLIGGTSEADLRDVIYGGGGDDSINGGYGNDELRGDAGDDSIAGGFGADTVIGGTGDDVLTGSAFGDQIFGGDGADFVNGGWGYDLANGGADADRFFHLGIADHGSDWVQDYNAAEGDVLQVGITTATRSQFQVNTTHTATAAGERSGDDNVEEAFVIYRPTGQILWALVDGASQSSINLQIGSDVFDLLA